MAQQELDLALVEQVIGKDYEQNPQYQELLREVERRGAHNVNLDLGDRAAHAQEFYPTHRPIPRRQGW